MVVVVVVVVVLLLLPPHVLMLQHAPPSPVDTNGSWDVEKMRW